MKDYYQPKCVSASESVFQFYTRHTFIIEFSLQLSMERNCRGDWQIAFDGVEIVGISSASCRRSLIACISELEMACFDHSIYIAINSEKVDHPKSCNFREWRIILRINTNITSVTYFVSDIYVYNEFRTI